MGRKECWIDKATKNNASLMRYLFEDFLDGYGFNNVSVVGNYIEDGKKIYHVQAKNHVKNTVKNFYFNDFSLMTDIMDNSQYVRKIRDAVVDAGWSLYVSINLNNEEKKQYKQEFKQYQKAKQKEDMYFINEMNK